MKLKLDENLGLSIKALLVAAGHDALGVRDQGLDGATDSILIEACAREGRCLVTLDLDFSSILRFPPSRYAGIAVLRVPEPMTSLAIREAVETLVAGLERRSIDGLLWVVRAGGIREYREESDAR